MSIRHASKDDCAAIAEIYNHAVRAYRCHLE